MKILLATDGSPEAAAASQFLQMLPLPLGSAVRVLSVVEVPRGAFGAAVSEQLLELLSDREWGRANRVVQKTSEALARGSAAVTTSVRSGDPAEEILLAADEYGAHLVLVGSKGQTGLKGFLIGSVARTVAKRSSRPVLVAREPRNALREVVVATDGSEHARQAIQFAARLPLPDQAQITIVHAVRLYTPAPDLFPGGGGELQEAIDEVRRQQEEIGAGLVAAAKEQLAAESRSARTSVRRGDPTTEILALTEERRADLIIAGARGVSMIEGLLMGSVADRLLKESPCSVLLVP